MAKNNILTEAREITAPREIRDLMDTFAEHRETYRRAGYNETQLRQDFLDPLFIAANGGLLTRRIVAGR